MKLILSIVAILGMGMLMACGREEPIPAMNAIYEGGILKECRIWIDHGKYELRFSPTGDTCYAPRIIIDATITPSE